MNICKIEKKREVVDIEYEICDDYCCEKMKEWLKIDSYSATNTMWYNTKTERYILEVKESGYDDDDAIYEEMNFCPFCGAKLQETKKPELIKKSWRKKK